MLNWFAPIGINTPVNSITLPYFLNQYQYYSNCCGPIFNFGGNWTPYYNQNIIPNYNYNGHSGGNTTERFRYIPNTADTNNRQNTNLQSEILTVTNRYLNCNEADGSQVRFCTNSDCATVDPDSREWCTDFVCYVTKEAYQNVGKPVPDGFGTHDVGQLKEWAQNNNMFLNIAGENNKGAIISQRVKPGDIVIFNEVRPNGTRASHTGIVKEVNQDGTFTTIEGNRNDKVDGATYSPDFYELSGFIQLT